MKNDLKHTSEEDLLKALETTDEKGTTANDFNGFINTFNLKPGTNKIKARALIKLYNKWSKEPITGELFTLNCHLLFESTKKSQLLINLEPLTILQLIGENTKKPELTKNSPASKKHFEVFIKKFELESGSLFIKFSVLYDTYIKWRHNNRLKTQLGKQTLVEFMNLYFKRKKDNNEIYYGLDPKILNNLTHEQKLQCLSQKSKLNAIKKENQKKPN